VALEVIEHDPQDGPGVAAEPDAEAVFFYDLADPASYLIAERIRGELPLVCDWEPVRAADLGLAVPAALDAPRLAAAVAAQELLALRLPAAWPPDSDLALRVATYAKGAGKSIAFSLAAFRQVFAAGRDLGDESTVLLAAAACEMHPTAVLKGAGLRSVSAALGRAAERAREAGVTALPALALPGGIFCGPTALDDALAALAHPR
jgi:2-hydroxychromene-2-carboxylate isomerase